MHGRPGLADDQPGVAHERDTVPAADLHGDAKVLSACVGWDRPLAGGFELYCDLLAEAVARGAAVGAVSSAYESAPVGLADQPAFINAAARLETGLTLRELLDGL